MSTLARVTSCKSLRTALVGSSRSPAHILSTCHIACTTRISQRAATIAAHYNSRRLLSVSSCLSRTAPAEAASASTLAQPVPALILKPHINFKALANPETAAAMEANIRHRNLPTSISVAAVNTLYRNVAEKTVQLDKARAERNKIAAEMKALFSGGGSGSAGQKGNNKKKVKATTPTTASTVSSNDTQELSKEDKEARRQELVERGRLLKDAIHAQESELSMLETELYDRAVLIPNSTHPRSPIGPESAAHLMRVHGVPRLNKGVRATAHPGHDNDDDPTPIPTSALAASALGGEDGLALMGNVSDYPLLDHVTLSKQLDLIDFESATAVTGSRWYYLKNEAALLELALIQFATQRAIQAGFMPVITPDVVRPEVVQACGFQPRDEASQTYWVSTVAPGSARAATAEGAQHHQHSALCLVATAEIALAGMNLNKVLEESQLPIKMAGFGRAFRAEAGSRGADVKGLYRVHQFSKVELFVLSKADHKESDRILEEMRQFQENVFDELGLCYRVLDMPTEELGASAYKKYDIEAWMPGRNSWGEISSTSNCTDYQARRLNIRYRTNKILDRPSPLDPSMSGSQSTDGEQAPTITSSSVTTSNSVPTTEFVHTLNGTAMAIPRIIVALLETYQQRDGSVKLPECLWPFMAGVKEIHGKGEADVK
ncbi:seryl-tRNA synthetase [Dissophora globulifera]|uniref:serine--tRNA ligase n=1 Tax=Dissophora globulifera TaxID=979702 RepID=A0A9P6RS05_9FUNG|nr:seryl-tRNA synthetase [Dissophora globulifera]